MTRPQYRPNGQGLHDANDWRAADGASRIERRARRAIRILLNHYDDSVSPDVRARWQNALKARVQYRGQSLAQIAYALHVSKDTYAAVLRRALAYADEMARAADVLDTYGNSATVGVAS